MHDRFAAKHRKMDLLAAKAMTHICERLTREISLSAARSTMMDPLHPSASAAMTTEAIRPAVRRHQPWYKILYVQVLIAIALGILIGNFCPTLGKELKPLGDGFIALIKMMIAPIIFCTVVHGISSMGDLKRVGRVGLKALIYFESGLDGGAGDRPARRRGAAARPRLQHRSGLDRCRSRSRPTSPRPRKRASSRICSASSPTASSARSPAATCCRCCWSRSCPALPSRFMGKAGEPIAHAIDQAAKMFFGIIRIIVRVAPLGAFGAMAFTIGAYGLGALWNLVALIGTFYLTSMLFVLIVLGAIARLAGFSILRFIAYIKDELLIVLGTSSSETVLPQMMQKMEHLGASRSVVGLVVPTGYSFNLDGTNIYMTLATLFLAQATNTAPDHLAGTRHPGHRHDHLEGRLRRDRRGLHHAGGHAVHRA